MADRTIKPDDTNDLVLSNNDGSSKLELNEDQTVKVTTGSDAGEDFTVNTTQLVVEGDTGNVGIGTTSPSNLLELYGSGHEKLVVTSTGTNHSVGLQITQASGDGNEQVWQFQTIGGTGKIQIRDATDARSVMIFDGDGNVGIGTTSPSCLVHAYAASGSVDIKAESNSLAAGQAVYHSVAGKKTGGSGAARSASLFVYWNEAATSSEATGALILMASDGAEEFIWADDDDVLRISSTAGQVGSKNGTVVGAQTSDERGKDILEGFQYGLEEVLSICPITYLDHFKTKKLGFGAQSILPIIPESVFDTKEDTYDDPQNTKLGMEYVQLIPVLTKAIQELSAKVTALENA